MEFNLIKGKFSEFDAKQLNPLVLAYLGDSIFDLFIRSYLVEQNRNMNVNRLNTNAISFVKAQAQCGFMKELMNIISQDEMAIFKRGRNSKSGTVPKNAGIIEYKIATGFEAILGYLYITEKTERLNYILDKIIEMSNNVSKEEVDKNDRKDES